MRKILLICSHGPCRTRMARGWSSLFSCMRSETKQDRLQPIRHHHILFDSEHVKWTCKIVNIAIRRDQHEDKSQDQIVWHYIMDSYFGRSSGSPPLVCTRKRVNSSGRFSILNLLNSTRRTCDVVMELLMRTLVTDPNAGVKTAVWQSKRTKSKTGEP